RLTDAHIVGVDNSKPMLQRAQAELPDVSWEFANLAEWTPSGPADLLVSNAALHWLDNHPTLFPGLLSHLRPGGVLAVQMPAQHGAASHQIGYDLAESPRWRQRLQSLVRRRPILEAHEYYSLLRPQVSSLALWLIESVQALTG